MKDEFIKIFEENIQREGSKSLLAWLEKSDFFTTPASSKYHLAHEGGLCEHSVNVYTRLLDMRDIDETTAVVALLHDLCKVNYYKPEWKNKKVYSENGSKRDVGGSFDWETVPGYTIEDSLPYGHGEKSVYIISAFMKLTREEAMAIRWHMGTSDGNKGDSAKAFKMYPLALMLHIADLQATFIDEKGDD